MRSLYVLLFVAIFVFVVVGVFGSQAGDKPEDEALAFLKLISQNNTRRALGEFGDNTCHCAPKGGYAAYLDGYRAAQEPNITFLLGKPMSYGQPRVKQLPFNGERYALPWNKPEDVIVYVPVSFPDAADRPYFIPLDSAFGYETKQVDLEKFDADPADWQKGVTLRMRASLKPGVVPPLDPKAPPTELEKAAKDGLLPADMAKYVHPADAGAVVTNDGRKVPLEQFGAQLPRLKSCLVGLKIVRTGMFSRWTVKKIGVADCTLALANGRDVTVATDKSQTENEAPSGQSIK